MTSKKQNKQGITVKKNENFSEWFTQVIKKTELADIRYNVKGFMVFQPWSVLSMEKMFTHMEKALQKKQHLPYYFPTVIPEKNFKKESAHVKGFTPEVFWLENIKGEDKLALRPTSETAFYKMFSLWIRSYKDLPFKTYQRANVFRYETKATRPFLRSREFYWIEAHCAHQTEKQALEQVKEDMETTKQVLHDIYGLPFIFFQRPEWDKFPGAKNTYAADVLNPDGRLVQQPSTHLLEQDFAKNFNVKFKDKDEKEKHVYLTCYGPAISRIFASIIAVHGDNKGLRFPWSIAPINIIITPITKDSSIIKKAEQLKQLLEQNNITTWIDNSDKTPGEKFYYWEMKGVPLRIELGKKELSSKQLTVYRRDIDKKQQIKESTLLKYIEKTSKQIDKNLTEQADLLFKNNIINAKTKQQLQDIIKAGKIARCNFCSITKTGIPCAEIIEKQISAKVRGVNLKKETPTGKCVVCGKKAEEVVYVARDY